MRRGLLHEGLCLHSSSLLVVCVRAVFAGFANRSHLDYVCSKESEQASRKIACNDLAQVQNLQV